MPTLEAIRTLIAEHQDELRRRYGVRVVGIFGSYARGEAGPGSDVDLLVDLVTWGALRRKPRLVKLIGEDLVHV